MRVYLDNAATTKVDKEVLKEMQPYFNEKYGNASSLHSFVREAKEALEKSREIIAKAISIIIRIFRLSFKIFIPSRGVSMPRETASPSKPERELVRINAQKISVEAAAKINCFCFLNVSVRLSATGKVKTMYEASQFGWPTVQSRAPLSLFFSFLKATR